MAGYIAEFFGYAASDKSDEALSTAARKNCPFLGNFCVKTLSRDKIISGVCALRQKTPGSPNVICCPIRLYAENYKMLYEIAYKAFHQQQNLYAGRVTVDKAIQEGGAVAVFDKGWGGELRLPQRVLTNYRNFQVSLPPSISLLMMKLRHRKMESSLR